MPQDRQTVTLEDVKLIFRNFTGKEGPYNRAGDRNFAVLLTPEQADYLSENDWNVKTTRERELDEGEMQGGEPYIQVAVGYKGRPPRVVIITSRGRTDLGEDEVEMLDYADLQKVDLIINPSDWVVNGKSGRKAYLKSLFAHLNEDELELKYADVPIAGKGAAPEED